MSYTEDALIEQPAIALFRQLGWETSDCFAEAVGPGGPFGRETKRDVVLPLRLRNALVALNPSLPKDAIDAAIDEIERDRSTLSPANANRDVYRLLKDGVKATFRDDNGELQTETVQIIDWAEPSNNDFLLTSQLWVSGDLYLRRTDLVGFVNGIPLVFIELKAAHKHLKDAFDNNLRDYKETIPQLFWYNAFIILSNGSQSKIGSISAEWEHFAEWKKINSEGEEGIISLDTMIRGTCEPRRLLDYIENFVLYSEEKGGLVKLIAKNHQFLGVNNAVEAVRDIEKNQGRLGVFWHTQGSGKTYSAVFFAQKVLRNLYGNYTFVIVTDRLELDQQIYQTFAKAGATSEAESEVRASNGDTLKRLLQEDHRYIFTLIQKFRTERGTPYPMLSDRSDVIVITDEAHRSQYDIFAHNMRMALPNAAFLGFTGTPLMAGEEKTKEIFGDYVSVYNFKASVEDKATVPLYYENRIPELQLTNDQLNDDMEDLLDEAELDPDQEKKLEREFAREYQLLTREERLDRIADDVVEHFMGRGFAGKAMFVAVDKLTATRMYLKVRERWSRKLAALRKELQTCPSENADALSGRIHSIAATDMALIVSQAQNEIADMRVKGIDFKPLRERMVREDLATKFKKADDPLRIVFVCAMWITGFDVPSCSTIYLDKPMKNHTLMQTIARANRVFPEKTNGLIVDYVGVFRNLQKALAIYAGGTDSTDEGGEAGNAPVRDKSKLLEILRTTVCEAVAFANTLGIDTEALMAADGFHRVKLLDDAVDIIVTSEERKKRFLAHASAVNSAFRAVLPDPDASEFGAVRALFDTLAQKLNALTEKADISEFMGKVGELLDKSVAAERYIIHGKKVYDLSLIDIEKLRERFAGSHKHTEVEKLQAVLQQGLNKLVSLNNSRMDFLTEFQEMIADYNSGSRNVDEHYQLLLDFTVSLSEEEHRAISEGLTEEELAVYDLLLKPRIDLTDFELKTIKTVAHDLLEALKREKLVLDWRKRQQTRAGVRLTIEETLDQLPQSFTADRYQAKCQQIYEHVYEKYYGEGRSAYTTPV